jgi:hypothetical protein
MDGAFVVNMYIYVHKIKKYVNCVPLLVMVLGTLLENNENTCQTCSVWDLQFKIVINQ